MSSYLPPHLDAYADFAERYDRFFEQFERHEPERVQFFDSLFERHGARSVLDCACGTGRDLLLFHSLGRSVQGTDVSPSMLARASQNLSRSGVNIPLDLVDYRDLPLRFEHSFDAVVCLSTSIAHMPDEAQVVRALMSMRGVLNKGGLLVLSQGTSDKQWRTRERFMLAFDRLDLTRLFVIDYLDKGARYNVVDMFHGNGIDPGPKVWSTDYPMMLLRDDQERLLLDAGFSSIEFFGDYDFRPYDRAQSDRLIAVAVR